MTDTTDLLVVAPGVSPFALDPFNTAELSVLDTEFARWLTGLLPALRDSCVLLEPLDESLTRWVAHHEMWCRDRFREVRYRTVLTTPPGRPRWLSLI